jgi:hypothetical protein
MLHAHTVEDKDKGRDMMRRGCFKMWSVEVVDDGINYLREQSLIDKPPTCTFWRFLAYPDLRQTPASG